MEIEVAEWDAIMAVNLRGAFLCAKAVSAPLKSGGGGKIINVSSTVALSGHPGRIAYAASKAGLVGLTRWSVRVQYPDDLFGALVFLASPDSNFTTGQTLVIDG